MTGGRSLLYVMYAPYWPAYRGDGARILDFIRLFRDHGWRVKVAYCNDRTHPLVDCRGMADCTDGLYAYFPSPHEAPGDPDDIDSWCPEPFSEMVSATCEREHFDVVLAHLVFNSRCLDAITDPTTLRVLDADNIFSLRHALFTDAGLPYNWVRPSLEQEANAWARADLIVAAQETEAEVIRQALPSKEVITAPAARAVQDLGPPEGCDLLTVGSDSVQNRTGLTELVERALPRIRAVRPEARLLIAGRVGRGFHDPDRGLVELGVVDDLVPHYRQASIVVNPVPVGTGLMRKTVDALCYGRCLVTTPAGVQGLDSYPDAYVRCDSVEHMGPVIGELLLDPSRIDATARSALRFAKEHFSPAAVFERLETALLLAIEAGRRVGRS